MRLLVLLFCFWLVGCASMTFAITDTDAMEGRDIDTVVKNLLRTGYECSEKRTSKLVNANRIVGKVVCGIKEKALICPKSYGIYLSYDLTTNNVTSIFKDERDNCF